MTTGVACPPLILQFTFNNGQLASGGSVLTQVAGVNTATYADSALTVPLPNPIPLNSRGEISNAAGASCQLFLTPNTVYTFTPFDGPNGTGNQIWQATYVNGLQVSLTQAAIGLALYPQTAAEFAAGVTPTNYAYAPQWLQRYGWKGDGATDDAPAWNAALLAYGGQAIYVPNPSVYSKLGSTVTIPANTAVFGSGKRTCQVRPSGNFDALILQDGAQIYGLYVEGNATTGHGLQIPSGAGNQTIQNCRCINFAPGTAAGVLNFADNTAGSRMSVHDFECWQTGVANGTPAATGSGKYAIYVPDVFIASAVPRKFSQIETSGAPAFFFGGCNDFFVTASFLGDLLYTTNSRAVQVSANRVANQVALIIAGANHSFVGTDTNPQIVLDGSLTNSKIDPGSIDAGTTTFYSISGITVAASAVVTISTVAGANPIKVGSWVTFDNVAGMTQINGLNGAVTAIGGTSGAYTATVAINSSGFGAYTSGGNLSAPGIVDNTGGNNSVQVFQQRQVYNPTLSSGGTQPVLGNGTLAGFYCRVGSATFVVITFVIGSTTTLGTGDIRFSLPVAKQDGDVIDGGGVVINHGGAITTACIQIPGAANYATMLRDTSGSVTFNSPVTFATGDIIRLSFMYEP